MTMTISSKTVIPTTFNGISDNHLRLHPQLVRTDAVLPYHPFGYNQNENEENGCIILLLLGWSNSCSAGVEAVSALESESIFSGRSRSHSRSLLKLVDSATLIKPFENIGRVTL